VPHKAQDDELVMNLVEIALARPASERKSYLEEACEGEADLFDAVWKYVQAEQEMGGFLRAPLIPALEIEDPFEPGQLLEGRFRIVREIARGGMGIVYEAIDERLGKRIALKCAMAGFRKRLPPEVRNATEISHPNVCKIFEIHTASTRQGEIDFLTMEFVDGETLAQKVKGGPLPAKEALTIALQLCAGLGEAHRKHVVHGDLKSSNVIVSIEADGETRAVITDFGLAYRPESAQEAGSSFAVGGTPDYMAPELWKGAKPSVASDIYALGVMLRELAYGRGAAVEGATQRSKWDAVIDRCLEADPERRYMTVGEVATALAPRTRRWLLSAAAAALLATISGVAAYRAATAPPEAVRLAVLPFEYAMDTSRQLATVKGSTKTSFSVVPASEAERANVDNPDKARILLGATHVLRATTNPQEGKIVLRAYVTDTRTQVNTREWTATYAPQETRFIPTALAGVVTGTFHLPALVARSQVNAAALQDYLSGLEYLRKDSTIESALPLLERALAADPDSALTHAAMAEGYWWKFQLTSDRAWVARSEAAAREGERRNPDSPEVLTIAGLLIANTGRLEQAQAAYMRAIELRPERGDAHRRLGMSYLAANDDAHALAALQRAVEVEPGYHRNRYALGGYYASRAEYDKAIEEFTKTVELIPLEPNAHFALGSNLSAAGRYPEAEKELRIAIDMGETPTALNNLGFCLMQQGRDQEAVTYFNRALRRWPERYSLWANLGSAYRHLGLQADERRAYQRAAELAEGEIANNPRGSLARAYVAYSHAWLGDRRRAASEIGQAMQLAPHDTYVLRAAAETYEALGQREDTLRILSPARRGVLEDLSRERDLADLRRDSRFLKLLADAQRK